jgi:hypothetical protein
VTPRRSGRWEARIPGVQVSGAALAEIGLAIAPRRTLTAAVILVEALYSDRGSPNHGSTLASKRVMAQIRSPVRVSTNRPVPWRMPPGPRR